VIKKKSNNRYILVQILCFFIFNSPTFQEFLFTKTPQDHKLNPKKWILETWGSGQLRQNAANSFREIGSSKTHLPSLLFCANCLPLGDPKEKSPDLDNRFSSKSPKYSRISEIFYFPL
jgi:hypothetical protein